MIKEFRKLTIEERELLLKAPELVSALAASWSHEISSAQKADAIKMAHLKTFTANPLLISYYGEVEKNFKKYFDETVKGFAPFTDLKRESLKEEINELNKVIFKLNKEFAIVLN